MGSHAASSTSSARRRSSASSRRLRSAWASARPSSGTRRSWPAHAGEPLSSARTVTRGHGLLEGFLARQRVRRANSLIPESARAGRVLDIGCGTYPLFLLSTAFHERYGLDRSVPADLREPGL